MTISSSRWENASPTTRNNQPPGPGEFGAGSNLREASLTEIEIAFTALGVLLVLIALRMPVGFALMLVSMFGIAQLKSWDVAIGMLKTEPFDFAAHWSFSAIPMFLLMGAVAHHSGISTALFTAE